MAKYTVQNPEGKKVTFEWSHSAPPTDADMEEVFAAAGHSSPPNPSASHGATGSWDEPKSNLRDDVTFLGSEKLGKIASGLFPRTAEAVATGKPYANQVLGAGLDQLSAGRLVAAAPEALKGGDAYLESVGDTEGKNWVGQTLRDPATGLALLTAPLAGFTGGLAKGAVRGGAGLVSRLAGGAAAGAVEGVASATAHQANNVQGGKEFDLGQAGREVALNTALPVAAGSLGELAKQGLRGAGALLKMHGEKIATTTIKPSLKDMKDGFRIANVYKHGLEGSLEETEQKLDDKFTTLSQQLSERISGSPEKVDMLDMLDDATKSITGNKADSFGKNSHMEKAAEFLLNEINEIAPNGVVDLATAQKLKRGLGKLGAWEWGKTDPESSARETLANAVYSRLKKEIEDKAPEGVREINQQLSELIPIERAVTRRIPIEARNSGLSLTDVIAGTSTAAGGMAAGGLPGMALGLGGIAMNRARKSPVLAAKGYRLGQAIQDVNLPEFKVPNKMLRRAVATGNFSGMGDQ